MEKIKDRIKKMGAMAAVLYVLGLVQCGSALNLGAEEDVFPGCDSSYVRATGQLCPTKPASIGTRASWAVVGLLLLGGGVFAERKKNALPPAGPQ